MAVPRREAPTPPPASPAAPAPSGGGLDVWTLIITALASAGAALVSSELFGTGTLVSAALTPVVIALLKEALDRPRRVVTTVVPAAVARPRRRPGAGGPAAPGGPGGPESTDPGPHAPTAAPAPAGVSPGPHGEVHVYRSHRRRWRLALVTGLLGFLLAAAVLTVTELAAGGAVAGSRATTYFGGTSSRGDAERRRDREQPSRTDAAPQAPAASPQTPDGTTTPDPAPDARGETPAVPPATPTTPADGTPPATPAPAEPAPPAPGPTPAPAEPSAPPATP